MCQIIMNEELNGIELKFNSKPSSEVLANIKANGFRWNGKKSVWYAKQSEEKIAFAKTLGELDNVVVPEVEKKATNKLASLWDRCQFVEGTADTSKYHYHTVGSNYTGLDTKETCKILRTLARKQFPECKFSIKLEKSTYSYNISFYILSSPYAEESQEMKAIVNYCKQLVDSYNFDDSDSMSDYFRVHFYCRVNIAYDYIQTEETEEVKADIIDFQLKAQAQKQAEEVQKEIEYQEYLEEQERKEAEYKARVEREKMQVESIENVVEIKEVNYFVIGSQFANLNKNCTLEEYKTEVSKGDYEMENVKVAREVNFTNNDDYNNFCNLLLNDFSFLSGMGGTSTDDNRIQSWEDYSNMSKEEQSTVKFYLNDTVAILLNGVLQFVVDPQGYNYARYVGLVDNVAVTNTLNNEQIVSNEEKEKLQIEAETLEDFSAEIIMSNNLKEWNTNDWNQYKKLFKNTLKANSHTLSNRTVQQVSIPDLKTALYRMLKECDSIQDQSDNLAVGKCYTIFGDSWIGGATTLHLQLESVEKTTHAQYRDAIRLTFKQPNKRGSYEKYIYDNGILIYEGILTIPDSVMYDITEINGMIYKHSKFASFDKGIQEAIINHFKNENKLPVLNTYKPIF